MKLTSVTYTSLARLDLQTDDLEDIHRSAREHNALDGITGLLVFNGTHFLQIIEGAEDAIEDLIGRLRQDTRHTGFEIRDRRKVEARSFPDWAMELVRVKAGYFEARETITDRLPDSVPEAIQARLFRMTELISRMEFPN
ncbi:BLUF domain-containing protein [Sphingomonas sp. SM33]|uniref:BLUF domain-containing protein n=1 Tax=Sphingomonas telluris TaxID=2907998 RepID=A0ABS9VKH4_9SPHN|nr:BLUF domain-containing protein [Sphingomonas telluris]MCH8615460.1 BLUF domain-containing protein [Sphingomonas telluris]